VSNSLAVIDPCEGSDKGINSVGFSEQKLGLIIATVQKRARTTIRLLYKPALGLSIAPQRHVFLVYC